MAAKKKSSAPYAIIANRSYGLYAGIVEKQTPQPDGTLHVERSTLSWGALVSTPTYEWRTRCAPRRRPGARSWSPHCARAEWTACRDGTALSATTTKGARRTVSTGLRAHSPPTAPRPSPPCDWRSVHCGTTRKTPPRGATAARHSWPWPRPSGAASELLPVLRRRLSLQREPQRDPGPDADE